MVLPCSSRQTRRRLLSRLLRMVILLLGLGLLGVGSVLLWHPWGSRTYHVHMLVDLDPNRALLAERIQKTALRHGLDVELSSEPYGSLKTMELVDEPNPIDLGLVSGGVARRDYANVRLATGLAPEPLQLLLRAELAAEGICGLKGRRVCLGPGAPRATTWRATCSPLRASVLPRTANRAITWPRNTPLRNSRSSSFACTA